MSIPKVSYSFVRLPDAKVIVFADHVLACMTGNPKFATPTPSLASVQTALTTFQDSVAAAKGGGVVRTAAKNDAREMLIGKLRSLALYVQEACANKLPVLLSSGYAAIKSPTPAGVLPAPGWVTLTQGTLSGSLNLRGESMNNAGSYEAQKTTQINTPNSWETVGLFTAPRMTLEELTPGTVYWTRMRAIGSAGPGAWSEPVSAMAI